MTQDIDAMLNRIAATTAPDALEGRMADVMSDVRQGRLKITRGLGAPTTVAIVVSSLVIGAGAAMFTPRPAEPPTLNAFNTSTNLLPSTRLVGG
jgi:hypothetical protein